MKRASTPLTASEPRGIWPSKAPGTALGVVRATPEVLPVRATTAFNRLLKLDGVNVTDVEFGSDTVTVDVALRRRRLVCPQCDFATRARYDTRPVASSWPCGWAASSWSCAPSYGGWPAPNMG